jgi:hypothetical protein
MQDITPVSNPYPNVPMPAGADFVEAWVIEGPRPYRYFGAYTAASVVERTVLQDVEVRISGIQRCDGYTEPRVS